MNDAPPRWLRRDWPDGAVLFDERTGTTHALTAQAVALLDSTPLGGADWLARLHELARISRLGTMGTMGTIGAN